MKTANTNGKLNQFASNGKTNTKPEGQKKDYIEGGGGKRKLLERGTHIDIMRERREISFMKKISKARLLNFYENSQNTTTNFSKFLAF